MIAPPTPSIAPIAHSPLQKIREVCHSLIAVLGVLAFFQAFIIDVLHQVVGVGHDPMVNNVFGGMGFFAAFASKYVDSTSFTKINVAQLAADAQQVFNSIMHPTTHLASTGTPPPPGLTPPQQQ